MSLNNDFKAKEMNLSADTTATFVAGRPVAIVGGVVVPHSGSLKCIGLVRESYIPGKLSEITGQYGIYGSGKVSVLSNGVATVKDVVTEDGSSYSVYDKTQSYSSGQVLFANAGLISNQEPAGVAYNGVTGALIGTVLVAPVNPANGDEMLINIIG